MGTRHTRWRLALIALGAALALVVPTLAGAAPSWLAPGGVSKAGEDAAEVELAANAAGTSIAVFENTTTGTVQASVRGPADTSWPAPVDLSVAGQTANTPEIAMSSTGAAIAVWSRSDGSNTIIQASVRDAGTGAWSAPTDLSAAGQDAILPAIALAEDMRAVVVWQRSDGANQRVQASVYDPAAGTWSAASDLSTAGEDATLPHVARKQNGDAVAVWLRPVGANNLVQASNYVASSTTWSVPIELSAALQDANNPRVGSAATGHVFAIWQRFDGANTIIQASTQGPAVTTWAGPDNLSAPLQNATRPHVAAAANGDAVAAWQRSSGTNLIIQAAARPVISGIWQPVANLSSAGQDAVRARVAIDENGKATVVWRRSNGANDIAQAAQLPAGGSWTSPVNLSAGGQSVVEPRVTTDGEGGAIAAWARSDGANVRVQAAPYDAAGPSFTAVTIPSKATVGSKVTMSATVSDRWSGPTGDAAWDFGDGTTATGASVEHTYKATGTVTVMLTQSDAVGNETSTSHKVNVTAAGGSSCTIIGTAGDDVLIGTSGDDVICGLDGNDVIRGLQGADLLIGGGGDDQIFGGQGNDTLRGQGGADRLVAKAGADRLQGGGGDDRLNGNAGDDSMAGGAGDDNIRGGLGDDIGRGKAGDDRLVGGPGDDRLFGQAGNDRVLGQAGDDRLFGLAGDDLLVGGRGFDRANGGVGNDVCRAERRVLC